MHIIMHMKGNLKAVLLSKLRIVENNRNSDSWENLNNCLKMFRFKTFSLWLKYPKTATASVTTTPAEGATTNPLDASDAPEEQVVGAVIPASRIGRAGRCRPEVLVTIAAANDQHVGAQRWRGFPRRQIGSGRWWMIGSRSRWKRRRMRRTLNARQKSHVSRVAEWQAYRNTRTHTRRRL